MKSTITKQTDGTITLQITIANSLISKAWQEEVEKISTNATIPGFRKGKAPKKIVEEHVNTEEVREEVLKKLLPTSYLEAVKEHDLKPIINPKIHVEKLEEGKDWQYNAITCEMPKIDLGDYKKAIKAITAKTKIIIPGKEKQEVNMNDVMKALLDSVKVATPQILIDSEVERLLSQLLDEIKKLGLTLDQYLASTNKTPEALKKEYAQKAEGDMRLEFALQEIAEVEKITVEQKEIDEAILKAKDEKEKEHLTKNAYLLANILRQQKTIDFLKNL